MTQRIFKYHIEVVDRQTIAMPQGARILCVQIQTGMPCLWAMVDDEAPLAARDIHIRGTGHDCAGAEAFAYIGTFQMPGLVFHVFDNPSANG